MEVEGRLIAALLLFVLKKSGHYIVSNWRAIRQAQLSSERWARIERSFSFQFRHAARHWWMWPGRVEGWSSKVVR